MKNPPPAQDRQTSTVETDVSKLKSRLISSSISHGFHQFSLPKFYMNVSIEEGAGMIEARGGRMWSEVEVFCYGKRIVDLGYWKICMSKTIVLLATTMKANQRETLYRFY